MEFESLRTSQGWQAEADQHRQLSGRSWRVSCLGFSGEIWAADLGAISTPMCNKETRAQETYQRVL